MRGCFYEAHEESSHEKAFPAYAGMFLSTAACISIRRSFPRVCGDVSGISGVNNWSDKLSPRMRGCFHVSYADL